MGLERTGKAGAIRQQERFPWQQPDSSANIRAF